MRALLCLAVALSGCMSVQHTLTGPRTYTIEARHADTEPALAAVLQRADTLCPTGYGIVQQSRTALSIECTN